jgi:molybdopterin-containing oxidoreductase family membrane subunit
MAAAGVWLDRFSLVVGGIERANLPLARPLYAPSLQEWALLAGTVGLFALLMLLFARFVPIVSMLETRHAKAGSEAA